MSIHQDPKQVNIAKKHIEYLKDNFDNVSSQEIDLSETYDKMKDTLGLDINMEKGEQQVGLALANTRSRLRMVTLYSIATMNNFIVCIIMFKIRFS